jgi:hypothetical protein
MRLHILGTDALVCCHGTLTPVQHVVGKGSGGGGKPGGGGWGGKPGGGWGGKPHHPPGGGPAYWGGYGYRGYDWFPDWYDSSPDIDAEIALIESERENAVLRQLLAQQENEKAPEAPEAPETSDTFDNYQF